MLRRPERVAQVSRAVQLFREAGIKCVLDNISGVPGETEDDLLESLRFYNEARPSRISSYHMRYYPATELLDEARASGALDAATVEALEEGRGSESFALGGTGEASEARQRLNTLLSMLLLLPAPLNRLIMSRRLYRFLPRNDAALRVLIRMADVLEKRDINAERYHGKYLHFLGRRLRGTP